MRKLATVLVCLLISIPLFAQQPDRRTSLYVFLTNPGGGWSEGGGSSYEGAIGVALQHKFTPHWSAELTVSRQRDHSGFTRFDPNGNIIEQRTYNIDSTPVDVGAQYHFLTSGSWKPYASLSVRYTDAVRDFGDRSGRVYFGAGGGVVWRIRPAFGIRFDGKIFAGDTGHLDRLNASAGVVWAF